jgi:hypothetical protein
MTLSSNALFYVGALTKIGSPSTVGQAPGNVKEKRCYASRMNPRDVTADCMPGA